MFEMIVLHFKTQPQNMKLIPLQDVVLSSNIKPLHVTALKTSQHPCAFKLMFMFHISHNNKQ